MEEFDAIQTYVGTCKFHKKLLLFVIQSNTYIISTSCRFSTLLKIRSEEFHFGGSFWCKREHKRGMSESANEVRVREKVRI